jgi:hypothetical protein
VPASRVLKRRRVATLACVAAVIIAFGTAVGVVIAEHDRTKAVSFHGRDYIAPETVASRDVKPYGPLVRVNERRRGMPLYLNAREAQWLKQGQDPTILFLRRGDGSFIVYGLSGGP